MVRLHKLYFGRQEMRCLKLFTKLVRLHYQVFIDISSYMHIHRVFGRSKRGVPAKAAIPANRGITVSIIGVICEKGMIDLSLCKSKAVQKKANGAKKRKRRNGKAEEVELNARVGTHSEHFLVFFSWYHGYFGSI
ncbi:hypothetical protein EDC96DRAFT_531664 [Choanephora cucurbitarum]|nr:hypothetical protein EDC96DRAFT_531664 [Choanephora cucurbitarum]